VHPLVEELTGKPAPATGLEGKFSVNHSAAIALHTGRSTSGHYTDAAVRIPEVAALRERVTVDIVPGIRVDEAYVRVRLKDGRLLEHHVEHALGSIKRPMNDAQIDDKFMDLAQVVMTQEQAAHALHVCRSVESLVGAGAIGEALAL
jgi:2-methylcitrate dehydratase PrpD